MPHTALKFRNRAAGLVAGFSLVVAAALAAASPAQAQTTLRVAMTAGDIPDVTGQPDQGFEGYRFVGYTLYDSLILWDLSRSDVEASLTPGLATKWEIDPKDSKRWIFTLRKDVKFHDGSDFNADVVLWNMRHGDEVSNTSEDILNLVELISEGLQGTQGDELWPSVCTLYTEPFVRGKRGM